MAKARVLLVLSGCGNRDGSEIHESVCAMLALDAAGYGMVATAPDRLQAKTVSYVSGGAIADRNALEESARIARGSIRPLASVKPGDYEAVLFPGGMGAAQTLCDYALRGASCRVLPEVAGLVEDAVRAGKPVMAMCIAPMILARTVPGVTITLGSECQASRDAVSMGAVHVTCGAADAVVDEARRVVTTPAYMVASGPAEVHAGAVRMVEELGRLL